MSRKSLVQKKFPAFFDAALGIADPSGNHAYLSWIAQQLATGYLAEDISATINFFHNNKDRFENKDIGKYPDLKSLESIIKEMGLSNRQEREKIKEGAEKIFEDENCTVVRTDTKQAMLLYGADTKWCTTMKNASYYEDYVASGNDFYILIAKSESLKTKSRKYAIVRRGFLSFEVYDEHDAYAREFSEAEMDILRAPVQSIVMDKPPKNMIRLLVHNLQSFSLEEIKTWMSQQMDSTITFIQEKRPDLILINNSIEKLAEAMNSWKIRRHLSSIPYETKKELAVYLSKNPPGDFNALREALFTELCSVENGDEFILLEGSPANLRARIINRVDVSKIETYLKDRSINVVKAAMARLPATKLIDLFCDTKLSKSRKTACGDCLIQKLSKKKVSEFLTQQTKDTLLSLAGEDI